MGLLFFFAGLRVGTDPDKLRCWRVGSRFEPQEEYAGLLGIRVLGGNEGHERLGTVCLLSEDAEHIALTRSAGAGVLAS